MEYKPLGDNVQIKIREKVLKFGIVITSDELEEFADVIAVGPDVKYVKEGDVVVYNKFAGTLLETKFDRILSEKDILAKVVE